jgi:hypothetical protein
MATLLYNIGQLVTVAAEGQPVKAGEAM